MKQRATSLVLALVVASVGLAARAQAPGTADSDLAAATAPCFGDALCLAAGPVALWPVLSFRAGYELQQPSARVPFVGQNDGFRTDQLWVGFETRASSTVGTFEARLVLSGAHLLPGSEPNAPVRRLVVGAADAFLAWRPFGGDLAVRFGQQRMPADKEGLTELGGFVFATRSVAGGGVAAGRGFYVEGISPGRELGLVVEDAWLLPLGFRLAYAGGLGNGNGSNKRANDNDLPAAHLRLELGFRDTARLAAGGHYNPRTVGSLPIQQDETRTTGFFEAGGGLYGFDLLALLHVQHVSFESALPEGDPNRARLGYGGTGWLVAADPFGLPTFGMRAGYRVSYYAPAVALPDEQLLEHAFALRYDPPYLPYTALVVDFTSLWSFDDAGLAGTGNRVFALVHVEL